MKSNDHGDTTPSDGVQDDLSELEPADLPGLEPGQPEEPAGVEEVINEALIDEAQAQVEDVVETPRWTHEQFNEWFENVFGGHEAFEEWFTPPYSGFGDDDLAFGVMAYLDLWRGTDWGASEPGPSYLGWRDTPWLGLSLEAKERFRRGWLNWDGWEYGDPWGGRGDPRQTEVPDEESVIPELAPIFLGAKDLARRRKFALAGGLAGLGLLAGAVALVLVFGGSDSTDTDAAPSAQVAAQDLEEPASAGGIAQPEPQVAVEDEPEAALALPDPSAAPFPSLWVYTVTKTADIVGPPDFLSVAENGTELEWYVEVTETCNGAVCTYASVVQPLDPRNVSGEIPEATWVVDGPEWSLDVTWAALPQADYGDGTVCAIEDGWTYRFTVTEAEIGGREIPTAFVGTWEQATRLDLGASTGDLSACGAPWEHVGEWSVVGIAGNP